MNQRPTDDDKLWELLGRHQAAAPSTGFAERTVRRLHAEPVRSWYALPVWRWVMIGATAVVLVAGFGVYRRAENIRRAEFYASTHQADYLEDYDVIASLDVLPVADQL